MNDEIIEADMMDNRWPDDEPSLATSCGSASVSSHEFVELKPTFLERIWGYVPRCRACRAPQEAHPTDGWVKARYLGDRRPPLIRAWLDV